MGASVGREEDSSLYVVFVCVSSNRLRKAAEDAANLTPEAVAANMSPEEKDRLSRVRNIGIAVCPSHYKEEDGDDDDNPIIFSMRLFAKIIFFS